MGMSSHQSPKMKSDVWLTPPDILLRLGTFDLDPCSPSVRPWPTATRHISLPEDGLSALWHGRVWMNPPFGTEAAKWMQKMAKHNNGIALIPARTETRMFMQHVWPVADSVLFIEGRPHFHYADGSRAPFNSGAPICLVSYGEHNTARLLKSGLGPVVKVVRQEDFC